MPTYLSELAPTDTRGRHSSGNQLMIATGILISAIINYSFARDLSWRWSLARLLLETTGQSLVSPHSGEIQ